MVLLTQAYGFLAVFAAGLALRRIERRSTGQSSEEVIAIAQAGVAAEVATDPEKAPAYMVRVLLEFNESLGRIGEVGVVLLLGGMLSTRYLSPDAIWFVPLLLLVIRPVSVWLGLIGSRTSSLQGYLTAWFGIRGIAAIYYVMYAINRGLPAALAQQLTALTLNTVAVSIVVHGISVTPLMNFYKRRTTNP